MTKRSNEETTMQQTTTTTTTQNTENERRTENGERRRTMWAVCGLCVWAVACHKKCGVRSAKSTVDSRQSTVDGRQSTGVVEPRYPHFGFGIFVHCILEAWSNLSWWGQERSRWLRRWLLRPCCQWASRQSCRRAAWLQQACGRFCCKQCVFCRAQSTSTARAKVCCTSTAVATRSLRKVSLVHLSVAKTKRKKNAMNLRNC